MLDQKRETRQQNTQFNIPPRRPSTAQMGFAVAPIFLVVIALFLATQTMLTTSFAGVNLTTTVPGVIITVENEETGQFKIGLNPQLTEEIKTIVPQPPLELEAQVTVNLQPEDLSAKSNPSSAPSLSVRIAPVVQTPSPAIPTIDVLPQESVQSVNVQCLIDMGVGVDLDTMTATFPNKTARILNPVRYGMPVNSTMFQFDDGSGGGCIPNGFSFSPAGLVEHSTGKIWAFPK